MSRFEEIVFLNGLKIEKEKERIRRKTRDESE